MPKKIIYAEDAIEALRVFYADECALVDSIEEQLEKLPSAQPEPCEEVQHILDYLDNVLHPLVSPEHWNVYSELYDMIAALPSAQPQRMKGRWTKAYDGYDGHVKCVQCFKTYDWDTQAQYYNFCPNCGSDNRGEEDAAD